MDSGSDMTMNSDPNAFCQGAGRVMLPGFQFSFNPTGKTAESSCVLWLFKDALVNTAGKYAGAVIGTYLLAVVFEMMRAGRARLTKGEAPFERFKEGKMSALSLDCINAASYIAQMTIAYWLMLLVMLYEAMIFIALVLGLGTGYFAVLRLNRRLAINQESNRDQGSAQESTLIKEESPLSTGETDNESKTMPDATHTSFSPCCGEA
jgi:hypothetical protein